MHASTRAYMPLALAVVTSLAATRLRGLRGPQAFRGIDALAYALLAGRTHVSFNGCSCTVQDARELSYAPGGLAAITCYGAFVGSLYMLTRKSLRVGAPSRADAYLDPGIRRRHTREELAVARDIALRVRALYARDNADAASHGYIPADAAGEETAHMGCVLTCALTGTRLYPSEAFVKREGPLSRYYGRAALIDVLAGA